MAENHTIPNSPIDAITVPRQSLLDGAPAMRLPRRALSTTVALPLRRPAGLARSGTEGKANSQRMQPQTDCGRELVLRASRRHWRHAVPRKLMAEALKKLEYFSSGSIFLECLVFRSSAWRRPRRHARPLRACGGAATYKYWRPSIWGVATHALCVAATIC